MTYFEEFRLLKRIYNYNEKNIAIPETKILIRNLDFISENYKEYPKDYLFAKNISADNEKTNYEKQESIYKKYDTYEGNSKFRFPVFMVNDKQKFKKLIFILHGLNERNWDKYLPWGKRLATDGNYAIILFPISYHINRSPEEWSNPRKMNILSKERTKNYSDIYESSCANAALSIRLHKHPEYFFLSGLRTYLDLINLIKKIRNNLLTFAEPDSEINFLSYSIGAFLTQILLMSDYDNLNLNKAFLFCGGTTIDLMYPVSRYIYDSLAGKSMNEFYVNNFSNSIKEIECINNFFLKNANGASEFKMMLNSNSLQRERNDKLTNISKKIYALSLEKDKVIPPESVKKILSGNKNQLDIKISSKDYPYDYGHENPFPPVEKNSDQIDKAFNEFILTIKDFFE